MAIGGPIQQRCGTHVVAHQFCRAGVELDLNQFRGQLYTIYFFVRRINFRTKCFHSVGMIFSKMSKANLD
jgi:hypothetical protein